MGEGFSLGLRCTFYPPQKRVFEKGGTIGCVGLNIVETAPAKRGSTGRSTDS